MGKRPSVGAVQHLEARREMLKNQLADMENRIYGRNNSFMPFITETDGKISEQKLNSFIKSLMNGVYKSGMHGFITNEKFKELCECFMYCAVQGIAEYNEKERYIVRNACYFSDIVNIARHKNNFLFAEENTLQKCELEAANAYEADDSFNVEITDEFQRGGFFRYSDIVFHNLTGSSITVTFKKPEYKTPEISGDYSFETTKEYEGQTAECTETDTGFCFGRTVEKRISDIDLEKNFYELAAARRKRRERSVKTTYGNGFADKYLRFRELFFSLDLYYRCMLFEYVELMVDLFLYNSGLSAISEDESFAMIYYRTNKLCAAVKHEAARRVKQV